MGKTADKIDFKKEIAAYRARQGRFEVVDVPDLQYLMIDGHGDPNTDPDFAHATEALYPLAYALKFAGKRELGRDYVVMPLEGLWWADDMEAFTAARDKSRWHWTLMIMVPDWMEPGLFAAAVERVAAKNRPARLLDVRLAGLSEGRCVQTLHIGSYDDETEVLARMHHEFMPDNGFRMVGRHHEIYLGDARRVAPEKLRTILRQPVAATGA
ncbi:GyrI-like domain-containing protein [Nocardia sp. NPDC050193]